MSKAKYEYVMDYIPDKDVYKAVMFARKMRRDGRSAENAIRIASKVGECRVWIIEHLLELLQVFGLTKQGSYSLQIQVLGNIGSGGGDSHGLVCHGYVWSQEERTKNQGK